MLKKNIALFEIKVSKFSYNPAETTQTFFRYSDSFPGIITTILVNPKINKAKYPRISEKIPWKNEENSQ